MHKPLTLMEPREEMEPREAKKEVEQRAKEALRQFKNILGWCGDKRVQYPETSAEEWLRAGVEWPDLRPELYLQLLKQLTRTDGGRGTMGGVLDRGWQLLVAAFSHWPPPKVIENYVAYFVKVTRVASSKSQSTQ